MCIQTYIHKHALLRGIKNEVTKIKDQVAIHKMHTACSKWCLLCKLEISKRIPVNKIMRNSQQF